MILVTLLLNEDQKRKKNIVETRNLQLNGTHQNYSSVPVLFRCSQCYLCSYNFCYAKKLSIWFKLKY